MLEETLDPSDTKVCILKCKEATQFFDFPSEDIFRNLWLYKLGLEHYDSTTWVCDRHFSKDMLSSSGKQLIDLAVPDKNLPATLGNKKEIYDQLIQKMTTSKTPAKKIEKKVVSVRKKSAKLPASTKNLGCATNLPVTDASSKNIQTTDLSATNVNTTPVLTNTSKLLTDSSNLLIDYQLRLQGKNMCDVMEMPQYIVVFTVLKPKELPPVPVLENDFLRTKIKENIGPLLNIPPSITVSRPVPKNIPPPDDEGSQTEIEYVYYMTDGGNPRREREIQVDGPIITKETAVQCDVELDNDMVQMNSNSQLYRTESNVTNVDINKHECLECGEIVANYASKMKHAFKHEKNRSLCPHCGEIFSSRFKLNSHEKVVHSENELQIKKALRCPKLYCKKAFHSRRQLNDHIDDHMQNATYKCNKCTRLFSSSLKLHCHQKTFKNCFKRRSPNTPKESRKK